MKTAAKVFTILGMVFEFFMIFPIIIGIIALNKLDSAQTKDEIVGIAIANLLLCSLLGGLFMLLISEEEFPGYTASTETANNSQESLEQELTKLKELKDKNLMTDEEYEKAKKQTIDKHTK